MEETELLHFSEVIPMHSPHMKKFRNYRQVGVQFFQQLSIHLIFNVLKVSSCDWSCPFSSLLFDRFRNKLVFSELEGSDQHWSSTHLTAIHSFSISKRNHWQHLTNNTDTKHQGNITKSTTALLTFLKTRAAAHSYLSYYISSSPILGSCFFFTIPCSYSYFSV